MGRGISPGFSFVVFSRGGVLKAFTKFLSEKIFVFMYSIIMDPLLAFSQLVHGHF